MKHFPDRLSKGRLPDRSYFFNMLNTINEKYVKKLIEHANNARFLGDKLRDDDQTIVVSEKMINMLNAAPFSSRKFLLYFNFLQKKRGELFTYSNRAQKVFSL